MMAGIGFELRRVLTRGTLSDSVGATLSGVMVVAGPWILTMLTLGGVSEAFRFRPLEFGDLFQATTIYSYALSLAMFSAVHFLFIRLAADLIWLKREGQASWWLIRFATGVAALALGVALLTLAWMPLPDMDHPWLFRVAAALLFAAVNALWVVMLFASILRRYSRILVVYALGMGVALALVLWWGSWAGVAGAVLGFAAGHVVIVVLLVGLCLVQHPPEPVQAPWVAALGALAKFRWLVLAGAGIYLGQWLDKMVYWATRGTAVESTWFQLYPPYDQPVYLAGLSTIPGLVYFVVVLETSFASALQRFSNQLASGTASSIDGARLGLAAVTSGQMKGLLLLQGAFTAAVGALEIAWLPSEAWWPSLLALGGAFLQVVLMVLLNLLFYGELHREAAVSAGVFVAVGLVGAGLGMVWPVVPGIGFLAAAGAGCLVARGFLVRGLGSLDRSIFTRAWV